ncbi:rhomboid family intramembrane serine protease [Winogradskyella sp.]|uniref:rhomboid family intramembrane serine protease n=1 Tax=Winogradskyella sp. TaxID=1883156 RepID=UPI0025F9B447|nr:rhomboid family intramembrane serine protease [Winogradskyella sp.]
MEGIGIASLLIIIVNLIVSYKGFNNSLFFEDYKFNVDKILIHKEYLRLVSSGFLHADWMHLIFNIVSLFLFSALIENEIGPLYFLIIYFISLIGGNLFALYIHRNHGNYSAIGASGAVSGIIFTSIALYPGLGIGSIISPFTFPSWIYGILFVAYSIYGIKTKRDNIGHEAHLGGAIIGLITALLIQPSAISKNYITILLVLIPTLVFIYLIFTKPHILMTNSIGLKKKNPPLSFEHKYNTQKANKQKELDKLLDKINKKGIDKLSKKEKQRLKELSK